MGSPVQQQPAPESADSPEVPNAGPTPALTTSDPAPASIKEQTPLDLLSRLLKDRAKAEQLLSELHIETAADLWRLADMRPPTLIHRHGLTQTQAAKLLAALELGKRTQRFALELGTRLDSPHQAVHIFEQTLQWSTKEQMMVLWLDDQHHYLGVEIVSIGSATEASAHPLMVFQGAIQMGASQIILAHNHPSGDPSPSQDDIFLTIQLKACAELLGITLLDHLVLGRGNYQSIIDAT